MTAGQGIGGRSLTPAKRAHAVFFSVFVPIGSVANLVLGLLILTGLKNQETGLAWLQIGTGAFCCMVAGWLAASAWTRYYWNRNLVRQVAVWRRIADVIFSWLEETPVSPDALRSLKSSLDSAEAKSAPR